MPPAATKPQTRYRQMLLVVALLGLLLRLGLPGSVGVDHFDEGIYAFAGEWPYARGGLTALDPTVIAYGPPVTPVLIGASYLLVGGPTDFAAILPGLVCGSVAVLVLARLAGQIFSLRAGLFSAVLLATSGAAVAFSRSALTDAPLMLFWLLAMLAGLHFLKSPGFITAIGMGLGVGLCQLAKYNGALTGIIVAMTALVDFLVVPRETRRDTRLFVKRIGWGIIGAMVAGLIYLPWFQFVERHGGYRALMKHHGGYMGGVGTWLVYLRMQLAQAGVFQFQWILMLLGGAGLIGLGLQNSGEAGQKIKTRAIVATLIFWVIPNAIWVGSVMAAASLMRSTNIGRRMVAVWLVFLSLLTPFYHPYARLWLPTMLASLTVAGWLLEEIWLWHLQGFQFTDFKTHARSRKYTVAGFLIWLAVTTFHQPAALPGVWSGRGALRADVAAMVPEIQKATATGRAVSLYISPAARWQLRTATPAGGFGPGRIVTLGELKPDLPGPMLIDAGLLNPTELKAVEARQKKKAAGLNPAKADGLYKRGLITILDLAPGAAQGETPPESGLIWLTD